MLKMTKTLSDSVAELEDFKETLKIQAVKLVEKIIPEKIVLLNCLIESTKQNQKLIDHIHEHVNIPVPMPAIEVRKTRSRGRRSPAASSRVQQSKPSACLDLALKEAIPCNKALTNLIVLIKPHAKELLADTNTLKMWVKFMIPKYDDVNNFSVAIQETVLNEINLVEQFAYLLFNDTFECFMERAKIVSKVATFPHITDYRRAVRECDENYYGYFCKMLCQIRDFYGTLHDMFAKNMDKIKHPRLSGYNSMCV